MIEGNLFSSAELKSAGLDVQKYALSNIFKATGGKHWRNSTNWNSNRPVSEWFGVQINGAGNISRLVLRSNFLRGEWYGYLHCDYSIHCLISS